MRLPDNGTDLILEVQAGSLIQVKHHAHTQDKERNLRTDIRSATSKWLATYLALSAIQLQDGLLLPTVNTVHKAASWFQALSEETDVGYCVAS